jgi:hypothetical protein
MSLVWLDKTETLEFKIDWNFISQWSVQPFNRVHFRKLFSNVMKTNNYAQ